MLERGLTGLVDRPTRLRADPAPGWSTVTLVHATADMRHTSGPFRAFLEEDEDLRVTVARIPAASLPDAPPGTELLGRLRMVHQRLLRIARYPVDASWQELGGRPAVLDRLADPSGSRMTGFSLAAVVDGDTGLVAAGAAPTSRSEALQRVALPLASLAGPEGAGFRWAEAPCWSYREELQISTPSMLAQVKLESVLPETGLREWTDWFFARPPFRRDRRDVADRPVHVRGLEDAWLQQFHWQSSASTRQLTTVVTGTTPGCGFSFVVDVPLEGGELVVDPETVLALVEVRPPRPPRGLPLPAPLLLPSWPAPPSATVAAPAPAPSPPPVVAGPPPVSPTVEYRLPPVPPARRRPEQTRPFLRGPRDRYLDAAIDRVMVAAVDIADADPHGPAVPRRLLPGAAAGPAELDVAAVRSVLDAILMRGWGPPLPWHGRIDVEALALARVGRWRRIATLLVAATRPGEGSTLDDEVWVTARLVATAAAEARADRVDERRALAGVLDRVRRGLEDPDGAWDDSLATVLVARPPRFRLTTGFDAGSGRLLWAVDAAARDRWDHSVDHFDLPVPLPLARHVQYLVDRYDLDHPAVGRETHRFTPAELATFRDDYLMTLDELRRALGPAYVIEERGGLDP